MGFMDDVRNKVGELATTHGDRVDDGIDTAADLVDQRTGRKHTARVDKVKGQAHRAVKRAQQGGSSQA